MNDMWNGFHPHVKFVHRGTHYCGFLDTVDHESIKINLTSRHGFQQSEITVVKAEMENIFYVPMTKEFEFADDWTPDDGDPGTVQWKTKTTVHDSERLRSLSESELFFEFFSNTALGVNL